jgi:xanthine dehydrogenase YagS FAD-binding subunit
MQPFAYARSDTLSDALKRGAQPNTVYLAGGTELLNWMRLGIAEPEQVIDIGRLRELDGVTRLPSGGLRIGALTRLNEAAQHPDVVRDYPVLSEAILKSASAQLRNLATVGGNPLQRTRCAYFRQDDLVPCNKRAPGTGCSALHGYNDKHAIFGWNETCVATHPADPPVALTVLDAVVTTERPGGGRRLPVRELIVLPTRERPERDTVLTPGELITGYELAEPAHMSAYLKIRERESYEYATVSCAVALEMHGERIARARIALGSVAHRPWRLDATEERLAGLRIGSPEAKAAIEAGFVDARPLSMNAYKIALAKNAVARTLETAGRAA